MLMGELIGILILGLIFLFVNRKRVVKRGHLTYTYHSDGVTIEADKDQVMKRSTELLTDALKGKLHR
jgi:hypothetical protein